MKNRRKERLRVRARFVRANWEGRKYWPTNRIRRRLGHTLCKEGTEEWENPQGLGDEGRL